MLGWLFIIMILVKEFIIFFFFLFHFWFFCILMLIRLVLISTNPIILLNCLKSIWLFFPFSQGIFPFFFYQIFLNKWINRQVKIFEKLILKLRVKYFLSNVFNLCNGFFLGVVKRGQTFVFGVGDKLLCHIFILMNENYIIKSLIESS